MKFHLRHIGNALQRPGALRSALRFAACVIAPILLPPAMSSARGTEAPPENAAGSRRNVVVFVADDFAAADSGAYGNRVVRTPNLDRLAGESVVFTAAFAASPTCAPSRAALLTGLLPFRNGAHANHSGIREGIRTLPACLNDAGYRTAIAGKYHIGPVGSYPFELIRGSNVPEPGHEDDGVLWTDLQLDPVDRWLAEAAAGDKPFVLIVNDHSPHVVWPETAEFDSEAVDIPPMHIDTPETRRARARYYTDIAKMDRNAGRLLDILDARGLSGNTVFLFTADQGPQWPFGKWNLYDYGIRVPLMVRWPGVVRGGTQSDALVSLVDLMPTILELAGAGGPPDPDGKSLVPLLRGETRSVRSEVFATHTGDGTMNRSPMRAIRTDRFKLIHNLAPEIPFTTHIDLADDHDGGREYWPSWERRAAESAEAAAVLKRYRHRPAVELYDIREDPREQHNLAADPEHADTLRDLRDRLDKWRRRQGDRESGPAPPAPPPRPNPAPYLFR